MPSSEEEGKEEQLKTRIHEAADDAVERRRPSCPLYFSPPVFDLSEATGGRMLTPLPPPKNPSQYTIAVYIWCLMGLFVPRRPRPERPFPFGGTKHRRRAYIMRNDLVGVKTPDM